MTTDAPSDANAAPPVKTRPRRQLPAPIRKALAFTANVSGLAVFAVLACLIGIGSSWYVVMRGMPFNAEAVGPWVVWTTTGATEGEPYSRARFNLVSSLSIGADRVRRFEARFDNEGRRLHSSCTYQLDGAPLGAEWWTLAVFDDGGRLIANEAQRYGFNTTTVARDGNGHFRITLSRDAKPGNWLPTGNAGRMVLILELHGLDDRSDDPDAAPSTPPVIQRTAC